MPDIYEVQTPDGKSIEIQSDHQPTAAEALRAVQAYGDSLAAQGQAKAEAGANIGRPMAKTAIDMLPGLGALAGGVLATPETLGIGTVGGAALGAGVGRGARDLIGHATGLDAPTTPLQKATHIGTDVALTAAVPGVFDAALHPIEAGGIAAKQFGGMLPRRLAGALKTIATVDRQPPPTLTRPSWQIDAPPPAEPSPTAAGPSDDVAAAIAKLQARANTISRVTPPTQSTQGMLRTIPQTAETPSPLRGPRIQSGAERVGRAQGLTTEQVRQQTGPVLDENPGEASPILPQGPHGDIVDALKRLPPGPAREAYVQAATSGKTKWQVENIRRTLEHLGLLIPATAGAGMLRQSLIDRMRGRDASIQ